MILNSFFFLETSSDRSKMYFLRNLRAKETLEELKTIALKPSNFEKILQLVKHLISSYGFTYQSLEGTVYFLSNLDRFSNIFNILQVSEVFQTFADYFDRSRHFQEVTISLAKHLLNLNLPEGNLAFINFSDQILYHLKKYNPDLHKQLKTKRMENIMKIIHDSGMTGQIFYALRQYSIIAASPEEDKEIRAEALRNKILVYEALGCGDLAQKYLLQLEKYDEGMMRKVSKRLKDWNS